MSAIETGDYEAAGIAGKGGMVVGVIWAENALSLVLIGMRSYTRRYIRGKLGWDDVCLWITWVLMVVFGVLITVAGVHGMGQHFDDLELRQFSTAVLYLLCSQFIVSLAIGMAKVVVAVFLLRIINSAWQKWFLWFCIISMMTLSCFLSVVVFAQCSPVQSIWDPTYADEQVCHISLTTVAFVSCLMDFALAGFPWIALRTLNMKRKERITICLSLSLGILTAGLNVLSNSDDYLYATSDSVIWTASEVTTTIVCVTLPSLRPLWNKMRGNESSSAGYRQHDGSAPGASGSYHLGSYPGKHKDLGLSYGQSRSTNVEGQTMKNDSDETVLLDGDKRNIMRVQEVTVTYENGSEDPSSIPAPTRQGV